LACRRYAERSARTNTPSTVRQSRWSYARR
jgi:hypothetical protein